MMKSVSVWKQELAGGAHTERLASLYCCAPEQTPAQAARYAAVLDGLEKRLVPTPRPGCTVPPAAPRSAATTPTTSTAVCWPAASTLI